MSPLSSLECLLWVVGALAYVPAIARVLGSRLLGGYALFLVYLVFRTVRALVLFPLSPNSQTYSTIWIVSEPVVLILYALVVYEIYSLVLRGYPGLATAGRWMLAVGVGVAALMATVSILPDLGVAGDRFPILLYFNILRRAVLTTLLLFLMLIAAFLVWFPVPVSRNLLVHTAVFSLYFLSGTAALLVRNLTGYSVTRSVSTFLLATNAACLLTWALAVSSSGESRKLAARLRHRPEEERRLLAHLDSLNSALTRSAGRQTDYSS